MKPRPHAHSINLSLAVLILGCASTAYAAVDADSAQALAKKNDCFKCHAVERSKRGPSLQQISAKFKGKADGEEKVIQNITSAHRVKLTDGTEEDHKVIDTKDAKDLKNLAAWILSQ